MLDFDLYRQFTWEHILGESQGGYLKDIRLAVQQQFPDLAPDQSRALAKRIEAANTVTACSFCNSTTSREKASVTMGELIANAQGAPDAVVEQVAFALESILAEKRKHLQWKLAAVKKAFEEQVAPTLNAARAAGSCPPLEWWRTHLYAYWSVRRAVQRRSRAAACIRAAGRPTGGCHSARSPSCVRACGCIISNVR